MESITGWQNPYVTWANKHPHMVRWMKTTWWTPVPAEPVERTESITSTIAVCIGDITYYILFCLATKMIGRMMCAGKYWNTFGKYAIRDISKHGNNWKPPEDYF